MKNIYLYAGTNRSRYWLMCLIAVEVLLLVFTAGSYAADKSAGDAGAQVSERAVPERHSGSHDSYDPKKGREIYDFDGGKMGEITFSHWKHQKLVANDCKICHHKGGGKIARLIHKPESCFKCHGKETKIKAKEAFHYTCRKCHESRNPDLAKCNVCHNRPVIAN